MTFEAGDPRLGLGPELPAVEPRAFERGEEAHAHALPDRRLPSAIACLAEDTDGCYRSRPFRAACAELGLRHMRTNPYSPHTSGKTANGLVRQSEAYRSLSVVDSRHADAGMGWMARPTASLPRPALAWLSRPATARTRM